MSEADCQVTLVLTTCFYKGTVAFVLCRVLVACNSLKTITGDKLYQRNEYYCTLIYTRSSVWPATRPHCSLNFGLEKVGPRAIKLAYTYITTNVTKVALFVPLD